MIDSSLEKIKLVLMEYDDAESGDLSKSRSSGQISHKKNKLIDFSTEYSTKINNITLGPWKQKIMSVVIENSELLDRGCDKADSSSLASSNYQNHNARNTIDDI